ncbi:MAG TPA: hypothetical protein DEP35_23685 [Deltaproteobacteria bacterium]|jgi:hypothetical protein|nr:hypothetical protein [Deltaproteobacteria bacterium]
MAEQDLDQSDADRILALARHDRTAAREAVARLDLEAQVALVCEIPVSRRAEVLDLLPAPEAVIPALPEAELCFTAKAIGLAEAGPLLEHATAGQLKACIDLDAWRTHEPDRETLAAWLDACVEAGGETVMKAVEALDAELLVLLLKDRAEVILKPDEDDWQPPAGAQTLEGQFYLIAKRGTEDLETILYMLQTLFERDYWHYFRLMQGVIWEIESNCEESALRWRTNRLQDLGFPTWEEAMAIYGLLREDERTRLAAETSALDVAPFRLPVWLPELPAATDADHAVFRAAAELSAEERRAFLYAFVALANKVAVADRMPLGDAESTPAAIEKAASVASAGLLHLAEHHGLPLVEVLRRAPLDRLFRVGAALDLAVRPRVGSQA